MDELSILDYMHHHSFVYPPPCAYDWQCAFLENYAINLFIKRNDNSNIDNKTEVRALYMHHTMKQVLIKKIMHDYFIVGCLFGDIKINVQ